MTGRFLGTACDRCSYSILMLLHLLTISLSPFLQVGPACRNGKRLSGPGAVLAGQDRTAMLNGKL